MLASLGRVDAAQHAARCALAEVARLADDGAGADVARLAAARARAVVEHAVEVTLAETGRATGPAPLVTDAAHARHVADLQVYVRQSHGDRDLAALGRLALDARPLPAPRRHSRAAARAGRRMTVIEGTGTPETHWLAWLDAAGLPPARVPAGPREGRPRAVVLAAHPDDEVLGAGGLLRRLARSGWDVDVVWASDGEASHPGSTVVAPAALARLRRAESLAARAVLGLHGTVGWLGLPDSGLAAHEDAVHDALRPLRRGRGPAARAVVRGRAPRPRGVRPGARGGPARRPAPRCGSCPSGRGTGAPASSWPRAGRTRTR